MKLEFLPLGDFHLSTNILDTVVCVGYLRSNSKTEEKQYVSYSFLSYSSNIIFQVY